jgi:outer membrane protein
MGFISKPSSNVAFHAQRPILARALGLTALGLRPLLLLTSCFSLAATAFADDKAVYVVDMQRIINESVIGKAARNNMEGEIKKGQVNLEKMKVEIDSVRASIEKQGSLLSAEAAQEKRASLEKKERELARSYQDLREELARKNNTAIAKVVEQIDKVVKEVASDEEIEFILEKDTRLVVYAEKQYDLTDKIIGILDERKVGL